MKATDQPKVPDEEQGTTVPEPSHAMPDRLAVWCRALRVVFGKAEGGPVARVMGKVYRLADAIAARVGAEPVWLSTAGAGVPWLHVRLDDRPKYYGFGPYRQPP